LSLRVENAKDPQEAAKIYPANYWTSLVQPGLEGPRHMGTYSSYFPKFTETRIGYVTHIQIRPNPLAN
jgi:hypothetical protein